MGKVGGRQFTIIESNHVDHKFSPEKWAGLADAETQLSIQKRGLRVRGENSKFQKPYELALHVILIIYGLATQPLKIPHQKI